jgi:hypothetical protein
MIKIVYNTQLKYNMYQIQPHNLKEAEHYV